MNYKKTTLKNGLRILTSPMNGTETVTVMIMVGVGSRYETEKEAGLSHFIEHMLFKGTKKRPNSFLITSELDAIGGEFNAFTSKEATGYYAKVDAKHISKALDVVSDMYLNSKFDEKEIEKERGTIIQELNMYEDMPMRNIGDVFENLLYPKSNLGRDIMGYKKTVSSFSRKDFLKYFQNFYVANDTVVLVAGKFDEKQVLAEAKQIFSEMPQGKKPQIKIVKENQKKPELFIKNKKTDQTHFNLGFRTFGQGHKDRFALAVLSTILGGNMSSRLFLEVREKRGLAYSVRTFVEAFEEVGYLAMYAGVEHKNLELTIQTALQEFRKISKTEIGEEELKKSKEYLKGKLVMDLESSDEVAGFLIDQEIKRKDILKPSEIMNRIDKVSSKDILRLAKNFFRSDRLNLAVIGPHKNSKKLEDLLKI